MDTDQILADGESVVGETETTASFDMDGAERKSSGCLGWISYVDEEKKGYTLMGAARGAAVTAGSVFVITGLNAVAKYASDCNGLIGDLDSEDVVLLVGVLEAVFTAALSPIFGGLTDSTPHRKQVYMVSQFLWAALLAVQGIVFVLVAGSSYTGATSPVLMWVVVIAIIAQVTFYEFSGVIQQSYLPELSSNPSVTSELSAKYYALLNGWSLLVIVLSFPVGLFVLKPLLLDDLRADMYQAVVAIVVTLLFCVVYSVWGFRLLKNRPATDRDSGGLKEYVRVFYSIRDCATKFPTLGRFLLGYSFLIGGVSTVVLLSTQYLNIYLGLPGFLVSAIFGAALLFSVPGGIMAHKLQERFSLIVVLRMIVVMWFLSFSVAPFVLIGEDIDPLSRNSTSSKIEFCKEGGQLIAERGAPPATFALLFVFSAVWGVGFGSTYTTASALYARLIPGGQEAEYMGLRIVFSRLLAWLPPILFGAIIRLAPQSPNYALGSLVPFFFFAFVLFMTVSMENGAEEISHTLELRSRGEGVFVSTARKAEKVANATP